ncbi:MAG TPA: acyltransferase family protein [Ornithinibacter sp.]|nr:acyltransferase family protein [Ornithinibacter sp.]
MTADVIDRPAPTPVRSGRLQRMPGLEGVRAIAVTAVLIFHANPNWLPGGFLGVDVFFTLSGFLITSLLLSELDARGRLRLGRFYLHRARRLLPALVLVLVATSLLAMTVAQDAAARVREDAISAVLYVTNWGYVLHGTPYFEATGRPPLLQHLWSLAVEEQFYLVWPLLLYGLWRLGGALAVRIGAAAGVLASTTLMAWIAIRDGIPFVTDSGRVYFGTDTHAMSLLVGAVLATYWSQRGAIAALTPQARRTVSGIGLASLVGLVAAFRFADPMSWALYRGGFLWVGVLTAGVVAAAAVNGTGFARALSVQPLRWVGQRSYGIYLWHWPIFMVLRPGADLESRGWPVEVARFGLTLLAASLSYRYVEMPVRRGAVGRLWADLNEPSGLGPLTRRHLAVIATVCTVIALGVGLSVVREPTLPDELRALAPVGTGPLTKARAAEQPTATEPATPAPRTSRPPRAAPPVAQPAKPEPDDQGATSTTAVGDSVMLAASAALDAQLPKVTVDAAVSRQPEVIFDRIRERKRLGRLGDVVVIGAGTNGRIRSADLTSILTLLQDRRRVVLVTCHADRSWTAQSNASIRSAGRRFGTGNVVVVDWDTYAAQHPRLLYSDGIHPRPGAGAKAYARLIRAAISQ